MADEVFFFFFFFLFLTGVGDAYRYSTLRTQESAYPKIEEDDEEE